MARPAFPQVGPCFLVGVAGFEPTTSSSRIRLGTPDDLEIWQCALVRALVLVGPPQSAEVVLSMFAPHLLPEPTSVVPDMRRDHGSRVLRSVRGQALEDLS